MTKFRTKTELLVIHRAEVDFGSYHFLVQRDGKVEVHVPWMMKAAHAKDWNDRSIGIAVFGCFASKMPGKNWTPTQAQYDAVAQLICDLEWWYGTELGRCGHSELGEAGTSIPEKLQVGHTCPGERWDWSALDTAIYKHLEDTQDDEQT